MQNLVHQGDAGTRTVPMVSIVVPCRNERDHIESAIKSILAQEVPPGGFEVIVADGMSDDGTREILKKWVEQDSRLRVIDNPRGIVSTGLNAAIKKANGSIIIRMDAHTTYSPDYVRQCVVVLHETGADNVGGAARTASSTYVQRVIAAAYHSPFSGGGARFHNPDYEGYVDTVTYGCWRREVFQRIGLFDEELVRNQDDEFNFRLVRSGGKIWQSRDIRSWYYPRESLRQLFLQYLQYGYWKARIIRKHRVPASLRHVVPGCFVLVLALLPSLAVVWPLAFWIWIFVLALYAAVNLLVSVLTVFRNDWKLLLILPVAFATFHFAYGWGFLRGVVDFIILRRMPTASYLAISRAGAKVHD